MSKILFFMCVIGCFMPATLMAKVEKVTLKGVIKGLGNEELILMNTDQSEIVRTKTKNDRFKITAEVETGDLRYYMLYAPSVGPLGPSMSIPAIYFFIDSPEITIGAELKNERINIKSLKGSPGRQEYDRIMASLPSASRAASSGSSMWRVFTYSGYFPLLHGLRRYTIIITRLFMNIMKSARLLKI